MSLVTRAEAAEILAIKVNTLYKWERAGRITPFTHVSGRPRYTVESLADAATSSNNFKQNKK